MAALRPIRRRRRLFYACLAVLLFLLATEAGLRLAHVTVRSGEAIYTDRWLRHPVGRGRVDWDEYLTLGVKIYPPDPAEYRIPGPVPPKPAGTIRLVCLGDSSTYGLGVNADETFAARLEKRIAACRPEQRVEVWNFGRPGYTSYQGRLLLAEIAGRLQPDGAVFFFGANDACPAPIRADRDWAAVPRWSLFLHRALYRSSYSYRLIRNLNVDYLGRRLGSVFGDAEPAAVRVRVSEEDFWANREAVRRMLPPEKGFLATVSAVYRSDAGAQPGPYFLKWRPGASDVDLAGLFGAALAAGENPFLDDVHPNVLGHRLIADALWDRLAAGRFVRCREPESAQPQTGL